MGTTRPRARLRRLSPAAIVLSLLAALLTYGAQAPASAADLNTVTAQMRLSSGSAAEGYYFVLQKDPDPATSYSYFTENYAPGGAVDVDLPPGTYKFGFYSFDSGDEKWYATGADTGADENTATPVVLSANKDLGVITFAVRTITTIVRDQGGNPVPNVNVHLADDPSDLADNYWESRSTDSQGRAVFRNQSTTRTPYFQAYDEYTDDPTYDPSDVLQAPVSASNTTLNLTMDKLATVSGFALKSGGTGVGLIQVRVLDTLGDQVGSTATTLSNGSFTVTGIPAGTYTAEFSDPLGDYETRYWKIGVPAGVPDLGSATFAPVVAHQQVTGVAVTLPAVSVPTPTGVDLAGVVSGRGKPLGNVLVTAYRNGVEKASVRTGRDGSYAFTDLTGGSYKVSYDRLSGPSDELPFVNQWYLGSRSSGAATPITVTQDSAGASRNVTLDSYGVITGSVLDMGGNPIAYPEAQAYDVDDNGVGYSDASSGTYRLELPPGTYHVRFDGWDDTYDTPFVPEWWDDSTTLAGAKAITVAPGQTVTATPHLTKDLETKVAPTITGTPRVGSTLTASTGTWNLMADNDYQYAWFRGATKVGSAKTYTPTAADAGAKLSVQVTAWHGTLTGTAISAPTGVVKRTSASTLTGKSPKAHVVKLTVTVSVSGVANPGGTVTIKRGSKVVKTGVSVVNGVASVKLTGQPSGSKTYQAVYSGTSTVATSTSNKKTITVK